MPQSSPKPRSDPAPLGQSLVLYVLDLPRLSAFYQQTLGLAVLDAAATHQLLAGPGVELVLHQVPPQHAAGIELAVPPRLREDTPMKPVFTVRDLQQTRLAAERCGGGLQPAERAWHWRGATVLDGWDPEGNVLQFRLTETRAA